MKKVSILALLPLLAIANKEALPSKKNDAR